MRVKIGPYKNYIGPYQLAEILCFWVKDVKDEHGIKSKPYWVHQFGEWLTYGSVQPDTKVGDVRGLNGDRADTWLSRFLSWIESKRNRTIKVHIDRWDTWGMDSTLAPIILPMLKQLKETKHGAPFVELSDVPENLRGEDLTDEQKARGEVDDKHFERWDWVLDEMIFAFESKCDDSWEDQFASGISDTQFLHLEDGMFKMIKGPNDTKVFDWEGREAYQERITNGFKLFGKYFEALWD